MYLCTMKKSEDSVFDKVLFVGPHKNTKGGMSAVMKVYADNFLPNHYMASNSPRGTVAGLVNCMLLMLYLPLARMAGRKILHVNYASGKSWHRKKVILLFARLLGFKTVMHCHCNLVRLSELHGVESVSRVLQTANLNIVLGCVNHDYAKSELHLTNCHTLNNPLEIDLSSHVPKSTKPTFLFMGILDRKKGIFELIEAADILKNKGKDFQIFVCGSGMEEVHLKEIVADVGLNDCIYFPGWISGEKKTEMFTRSHVFVLPSYTEGMPMSIIESKGYGLPVISTTVGSIPQMVNEGETGFLVAPADAKALAEAMQRYIDNPELLKLHSRNSLASAEEYNVDNIRKKLEKLYESIL